MKHQNPFADFLRFAALCLGVLLFIYMVYLSGRSANNRMAVEGKPYLHRLMSSSRVSPLESPAGQRAPSAALVPPVAAPQQVTSRSAASDVAPVARSTQPTHVVHWASRVRSMNGEVKARVVVSRKPPTQIKYAD